LSSNNSGDKSRYYTLTYIKLITFFFNDGNLLNVYLYKIDSIVFNNARQNADLNYKLIDDANLTCLL